MKLYLAIIIIALLIFSFQSIIGNNANSSFADLNELSDWLEYQSATSKIIALRNDVCVQTANVVIDRLHEDGYYAEQFTILSPYYFYELYPSTWRFIGGAGHAVVRVKVADSYYLVEPTYWMAWEITEKQKYAGVVSNWK